MPKKPLSKFKLEARTNSLLRTAKDFEHRITDLELLVQQLTERVNWLIGLMQRPKTEPYIPPIPIHPSHPPIPGWRKYFPPGVRIRGVRPDSWGEHNGA